MPVGNPSIFPSEGKSLSNFWSRPGGLLKVTKQEWTGCLKDAKSLEKIMACNSNNNNKTIVVLLPPTKEKVAFQSTKTFDQHVVLLLLEG